MDIVAETLAGNRLALSKLLTEVENGTALGQDALIHLFQHTGRAHLIGVTGAPGTGKSTLVNRLAAYYRTPGQGRTPQRIAILAVDPSSPFTGGAILGDRIRMRDLSGDSGVFIRSTASRGTLGGLAKTTASLVEVFDAAGFERILIETVGAGQAEVDIARLAHTTLVIEAPGMGDDIQAIKAGIFEIADVLVINKADRPGAADAERALRSMLKLAHPVPRLFHHHGIMENAAPPARATGDGQTGGAAAAAATWIPPIRRTVATEGEGIEELAAAIEKHYQHLRSSGDWELRERARIKNQLDLHLQASLVSRWREALRPGQYEQVLDRLVARKLSPEQAAQELTV